MWVQWFIASHHSIEKYWNLNGDFLIRIYENIEVSFESNCNFVATIKSIHIQIFVVFEKHFHVRKFTICHLFEQLNMGRFSWRKLWSFANQIRIHRPVFSLPRRIDQTEWRKLKTMRITVHHGSWNTSKSFSLEFE